MGVINWLGMPLREEMIGPLPELIKISKMPVVWIVKPHSDIEKIVEYIKRAEEVGVSAVGCDIDAGPTIKMGEIEFPFGAGPHTDDEYRRIRNATGLPFILKGVTSVEDAHKAVEIGADAIVVSIHGGYGSVDYGVPPMMALREIADAVGDRIEILVDGQIRRGTHILKALALGAKTVLIGRPVIWALAVGQTDAIVHVFEILTDELVRGMKYAGVEDVTRVPQDIVILPSFFPMPRHAPFP